MFFFCSLCRQQIKLAVYDIDSSNPEKLGEQELLGRYETTMAYFIKSQNKLFTAVLKDSPGKITITFSFGRALPF